MAENYIEAEQDYLAGMKYKDIAEKYDVTINTVKSWKTRYGWERDKKGVHTKEKKCAHKKEKVCTQKTEEKDPEEEGLEDTFQNQELTPKQQMFCALYSKSFNAAQSYQKAYGCAYATAMTNGPRMLRNAQVCEEIERLKKIKRQQVLAGEDDVVELQTRIAFSDIGDILQFSKKGVTLNDSANIDTQLIRKVKEGRYGIAIEMEDRQKSIDWLSKYLLLHPDDRYRAEVDRQKAEAGDGNEEAILQNMRTLAEVLQKTLPNRKIEDFEEE